MENQAEERLSELTREIEVLREWIDEIVFYKWRTKNSMKIALKKKEIERDSLIERLGFRNMKE